MLVVEVEQETPDFKVTKVTLEVAAVVVKVTPGCRVALGVVVHLLRVPDHREIPDLLAAKVIQELLQVH
jgi:hypothetical protein